MAPRQPIKITRDLVLFCGGLLGAAHEILLRDDVREAILLLLGGMMGLPAFLNHDEKREKKNDNDDEDQKPSPKGG